MRIVKEAEERKNEIIEVSERLFCTKGFDNTTTNDILNEIGIARGTLYYHFKSKEDILDAVINRTMELVINKASSIAFNECIPVLERLTNTIISLNVENETGYMIMEQVHRPQNILMHQKIQERLTERVNPLITKIVRDGIQEGIWNTDYPEEAVEMIMMYSNIAFDYKINCSQEEKERKILGFIYNIERLLDMKKDSLKTTVLRMFNR